MSPRPMRLVSGQALIACIAVLCAAQMRAADTRPDLLGEPKGTPFRDAPAPQATLVGLRVSTQLHPSRTLVSGIEPIYRTGNQTGASRLYGKSDEQVSAEARPGYAVGAIIGQAAERVYGLRLVFMREQGDRLDPKDSYESRWMGLRSNGPEVTIGGDGRRVIGVHGYTGERFNALGLLLAGDQLVGGSPHAAPDSSPLDQQAAIAAIEKLGGRITRDNRPGRPVIGIDLSGLQLASAQLAPLRAFSELETLDLSNTYAPFDHVGLEHIAGLTKLRNLNLKAAYPLHDEDLAHLRGLTNLRVLWIPNTPTWGTGLLELTGLVDLEQLEAGGSKITDDVLLQLNRLTKLRHLVLHNASSLTHAGLRVLHHFPKLTYLALDGVNINDDTLAALPALEHLEDLFLRSWTIDPPPEGNRLSVAGLRAIARYRHLKRLSIISFEVTAEGLECLAPLNELELLSLERLGADDSMLGCLAHFPAIKLLIMDNNSLEGDCLRHLADHRHLEQISLTGTGLTDEGLSQLRPLTSLKILRLGRTSISSAGLAHLSGLSRLTDLDLSDTDIDDQGLAHLGTLKQLKKLYLSGTQLIEPHWADLADLTKLGVLWLGGTQLTDGGLAHLNQFTRLASLEIDHTHITDAGLVHLQNLSALNELNLSATATGDSGVRKLSALTGLSAINFAQTRISDAALDALRPLSKLKILGFAQTNVTNQGLNAIEAWPELTKLYVFNSRINSRGIQRAQRALPLLQVVAQSSAIPEKRP